MKPDETALLAAFAVAGGRPPAFLRDIGAELGVHPKRVAYIAGKWSGKGWYDYGVTVDLGWLTEEGWSAARRARGEE